MDEGSLLNFRSTIVGNAYVVRWTAVPGHAENQALLQELREARQKVGAGLLFCGIIPDGVGVPNSAERDAMQASTPAILECTDALQLVIDGQGVTRTLLRTLIRGMVIAGRRSDKVIVHATFVDFLRVNEAKLGIDRAVALERARRDGIA